MTKLAKGVAGTGPGCLLEFMHGDKPQLAWVLEENSGKYRVLTVNRRESKLPAARVLPWTGPCLGEGADRQAMEQGLDEHQAKREEIAASLDVMEIWEMAQGEVDRAATPWFAQLIFDEPDADQIAAVGRALLSAKTHFKFQPPHFEIHPREKVEQRLKRAEEDRERERVIETGQALLKGLWSNRRAPEGVRLDEDVQARLERLLLSEIAGTSDERNTRLWTQLKKGLPDHPHLALVLARAWKLVSPHHNHLLDEAGYVMDDSWAEEFQDGIEAVIAAIDSEQTEPEPINFVSIDAATTKDIDDAFHVQREGDGYKLTLALARPTLGWEFGSPLDRAVLNRATSIYLPEGSGHMLPLTLGIDRFSLRAGEVRPAMVTDFQLDGDGRLLKAEPRSSWVKVERNATYDEAEQAMESGSDPTMILAHELGEKLQARRLEAGAAIIDRPDPQVVLDEAEDGSVAVDIVQKQPTPMAGLAVSEFMILANAGLAAWAQDNDVPLLHRTQNIALPSDAQGIFSEPEDIFKVVKLMAPPMLEIKPRRHAALAVDGYAPVTSPIRRYTDLINSAQIATFLATRSPRFTADQLTELMPTLNSRLGAASQIQRFRPRYWKLLYLAQRRKEYFPAVLVEDSGMFPTLAMPWLQINIRCPKNLLNDKLMCGQRFSLRFGRIDPLTNEIKVAEALEE